MRELQCRGRQGVRAGQRRPHSPRATTLDAGRSRTCLRHDLSRATTAVGLGRADRPGRAVLAFSPGRKAERTTLEEERGAADARAGRPSRSAVARGRPKSKDARAAAGADGRARTRAGDARRGCLGAARGPPRDRRLRARSRSPACRVTTAAARRCRRLVHVPAAATSSGCSARTAPASRRSSPSSERCSRRRRDACEYGSRTTADNGGACAARAHRHARARPVPLSRADRPREPGVLRPAVRRRRCPGARDAGAGARRPRRARRRRGVGLLARHAPARRARAGPAARAAAAAARRAVHRPRPGLGRGAGRAAAGRAGAGRR